MDLHHHTSHASGLESLVGRPLRTDGCIMLYCTEGRAVVDCNFTGMALKKGFMALLFSDTLFSIRRTSPGFSARYFELSAPLTDETTFTSAGELFDWLYEHPVFRVPPERDRDIALWLSVMEWIDNNTEGKYRSMMLRNQWHNFFIGLEAVMRHRLTDFDTNKSGAGRHHFNEFCKLLSEHCRRHHDVRFYADRLCITPYYLSRITHRIFAVSPKELIDRQITMEIKSLLTTTDLSVKEIAELYGFESSSYLGRYLRRHTGLTPSEYRDRNR